MSLCIQNTGSPRLSVYGVCSKVCSTGAHNTGGGGRGGGGTDESEELREDIGSGGGAGGWTIRDFNESCVWCCGGGGGRGGGGKSEGGREPFGFGVESLFVWFSTHLLSVDVLQNLCSNSIGRSDSSVPTF